MVIGYAIYPHVTRSISSGDRDVLLRTEWCTANCQGQWTNVVGDWNWYEDRGHLRPVWWEFEDRNDLLKFLLRWTE